MDYAQINIDALDATYPESAPQPIQKTVEELIESCAAAQADYNRRTKHYKVARLDCRLIGSHPCIHSSPAIADFMEEGEFTLFLSDAHRDELFKVST
jgi:hypothetical protein